MVSKNNSSYVHEKIGQFFTPSYVAKFMVKNIFNLIKKGEQDIQTLKILEPSAGEGVFLKYLLNQNVSNINAYEIDVNLKEYLLQSYPQVKFKFENFLGSNLNEKFDVIIGNPPYLGQNYNAKIFQDYVENYPSCAKYFAGNMDLFYFFIHLGIDKLNPGGLLSYITTNYWLTKSKKTGIKLLKPHILDECYLLQYLDLSQLKLFEGAKGQHNCIFLLQKKTKQEKMLKKNKNIEIIQVLGKKNINGVDTMYNQRIFNDLIGYGNSEFLRRYTSALTNRDLEPDKNWNLIFPIEAKSLVDKIEGYCKINQEISFLNDYFHIRNGLILIKDSIFILNENKELKIENDDFYIRINGNFVKLTELEKKRLKKVYKSKSIKPYGYTNNEHIGYIIYFNKNEFKDASINRRNQLLDKKYSNLTRYLHQFKHELQQILINAKENPKDIYFPRRGAFIRGFKKNHKENLVDLEPLYDSHEKIFFKFISDENLFGYSNDQYYATSDTYFLWPKSKKIDYMFYLAYLNSKLVSFLYKAKNITIKRSKTKLEYGLPMPNLKNFEEKSVIIDLIKNLTSYLVKNSKYAFDDENSIKNTINKLFFSLFNMDEDEINKLLKEYYTLQLN